MTLLVVGLTSLIDQVVVLRELSVAFYGIELVYLLAVAAWLAGTAAGASLVPRGLAASRRRAAWAVAAAAVALPIDVAWIRGSRLLLGAVPGAYLPIGQQLLVLVVSVTPLAFLCGLAFRWAAAVHVSAGGRLPGAYAIESAGAAAGGIASTLAFRSAVPAFAVAAGSALAVLAWALAWGAKGRARVLAVSAGALVVGAATAGHVAGVDWRMTRWNHPSLVETRDTPYARVTITRSGSQVAVFENDVLTHESETAFNEELPHLAALQHASPKRILLLGGSTEGIDRELARHGPEALDQVEIDSALVDSTRGGRSAGRLHIADPRSYLARSGPYDLIVIAVAQPVSGQANRFYTREFFELCAKRLDPAGVVALRLQVPENYASSAALGRAASVARALRAAFSTVEFLPGRDTVALASQAALPPRSVVIERLRERRLDTRLVTPAYVDYLYSNDRRDGLRRSLSSARVPMNRDAQPVSYFYAAVGWLSKFVPGLIGPDAVARADVATWPGACRWGPLAALALVVAAARLRPRARRAALALMAGLCGMVIETVVLLNFQAARGALFEDLGLLLTAFMAGSAAGAWLVSRSGQSRARGPRTALLLAGLAGCALLARWMVEAGAASGLWTSALLLAATGGGVAGLFACASRMAGADDEAGMGRLYGADLLGGCIGSIAASLVLVPLAGLGTTSGLVALLALVSLLLA